MSIIAIRSQLATLLAGIQGVARVYTDEPGMTPFTPDLPCFLLTMNEPYLVTRSEMNSTVAYDWNFALTLLSQAEGIGTIEESLSGVEKLLQPTIDMLYANFAGGGKWDFINKDTGTLEFTVGLITKQNAPENTKYWGFQGNLIVTQFVTTTMSIGS